MPVDAATLSRLSRLARLDISARTDASQTALQERLNAALRLSETTHSVDVQDIVPLLHPADLQTWMRSDEPVQPPGAAVILRNAPAKDQDSFLVPQVVDDNA